MLSISANEITFGNNGSGTIDTSGFDGGINLTASQGVLANGPSVVLNVAAANLNIVTPFVTDEISTAVDREGLFDGVEETQTESNFGLTLTTTGNVDISSTGRPTFDASAIAGVPGSSLSIEGNNVAISGTTLNATSGSLTVKAAGAIALKQWCGPAGAGL